MQFVFFTLCLLMQSIYGSGYSLNLPDAMIRPPNRITERVFGGADAPDGHAPFQCSFQVNGRHYCGCAIISNQSILTAAHCLRGIQPEDSKVLVGTDHLRRGGQLFATKRFFAHENYNKPLKANDIAVVEVNGPIAFNDDVQPIEIEMEEIPEGTELELTGWGETLYDKLPKVLQLAKLNYITNENCKKLHISGSDIGPSQLCTLASLGIGACHGDSGGPLVIRKSSGVKIVGIVSFGVPCALGVPDVFTRVSHYRKWINNHIA